MKNTEYNNILNQLEEEVSIQKDRSMWGPMEEFYVLRGKIEQPNIMDKVAWILQAAKQFDTLNAMICTEGEKPEKERLENRKAGLIMKYSFQDTMNGKLKASFKIHKNHEGDAYALVLSSGAWGINNFPDNMTPVMVIDGTGDVSFQLYNRFNQPREHAYERELNELKAMNAMMELFIEKFDRYYTRSITRVTNNIELYRNDDAIYQEEIRKRIQDGKFPYETDEDKEHGKQAGKGQDHDER